MTASRVAAALLAAAGALHLAMAPIHADGSARQAVAFAVVGTVQVALGGVVLARPGRRAAVAGVAVQAVALAAWAWSRRWGLPFDLGGPEDVARADAATAGLELAGVLAGVSAVRGLDLPRRVAGPALVAIAVVVGAVVADPATAEHGGHEHGEEEVAAEHAHDDGAGTAAADACPEDGGEAAPAGPPTTGAPRLAAAADAALAALAAASPPLPCGAIAAAQGGHGHGVGDAGATAAPADPAFDAEWAAAVAAGAGLATPDAARAAGYVLASPQVAGVGTHWINWELVDRPFDPARPSMLLYDERPERPPRLAGFSYWVRSRTAPVGFAGSADVWHRHVGLCFVDGWLRREQVASPDACEGYWLNGGDLWMLHAWVVPSIPNSAGPFAGRNDALCPPDFAPGPDILRCEPAG